MRLHGSRTVVLFGAVLFLTRAASAQSVSAPARPAQPLLGSSDRTSLGAAVAAFGGYDRAALQKRTDSDELRRRSDGTHGGMTANLNYARSIARWAVGAWGATDLRYYGQLGALRDAAGHTSSAGVTIAAALGARGSLRVTQNLGMSSFYQFDPTSGLAIRSESDLQLPTSDYRLERGRTSRYDLNARGERRFGRHALLALDFGYHHARFPGELVQYSGQHAGFRFEHGVTRDLSFRWGYGYDRMLTGAASVRHEIHRLDIGPTYAKTLAVSRRTSLSAAAGAALVTLQAGDAPRSVLALVAMAGFRQRVGRTWAIGGDYRREPQPIEIYRETTYADSAAITVTGSPTPRITLGLSGGAWRASLDPHGRSTAGLTMFGSVRSQVIAARTIAVFADYSYYAFETETPLTGSSIATGIGRHALRTGLRWSLPLLSARR